MKNFKFYLFINLLILFEKNIFASINEFTSINKQEKTININDYKNHNLEESFRNLYNKQKSNKSSLTKNNYNHDNNNEIETYTFGPITDPTFGDKQQADQKKQLQNTMKKILDRLIGIDYPENKQDIKSSPRIKLVSALFDLFSNKNLPNKLLQEKNINNKVSITLKQFQSIINNSLNRTKKKFFVEETLENMIMKKDFFIDFTSSQKNMLKTLLSYNFDVQEIKNDIVQSIKKLKDDNYKTINDLLKEIYKDQNTIIAHKKSFLKVLSNLDDEKILLLIKKSHKNSYLYSKLEKILNDKQRAIGLDI